MATSRRFGFSLTERLMNNITLIQFRQLQRNKGVAIGAEGIAGCTRSAVALISRVCYSRGEFRHGQRHGCRTALPTTATASQHINRRGRAKHQLLLFAASRRPWRQKPETQHLKLEAWAHVVYCADASWVTRTASHPHRRAGAGAGKGTTYTLLPLSSLT